MAPFAHEWIMLGFAAGCLVVSATGLAGRRTRVPPASRSRCDALPIVTSAAAIGVVLLAGRFFRPEVRLFLGLVYLPAGYWLPALIRSRDADPDFTRWLQRGDARVRRLVRGVPRWLVDAADLCYLLCYPMVPAGFLVLVWLATPIDQQRFWVAVLTAGFCCYATLPWLVSLPPRRLPGNSGGGSNLHALNVAVLRRVSHGFNTFPSGHAAVSTAVALAAIPVPAASIVFGIVAGGVALGAIVGRHHYVVDVAIGLVIGLAAGLIGYAVV